MVLQRQALMVRRIREAGKEGITKQSLFHDWPGHPHSTSLGVTLRTLIAGGRVKMMENGRYVIS